MIATCWDFASSAMAQLATACSPHSTTHISNTGDVVNAFISILAENVSEIPKNEFTCTRHLQVYKHHMGGCLLSIHSDFLHDQIGLMLMQTNVHLPWYSVYTTSLFYSLHEFACKTTISNKRQNVWTIFLHVLSTCEIVI